MKTAIVILNFNTRGMLGEYLPGVLRSVEGEDACVVVADNGSSDGSVELLKESFPQVKTIILDRNYGYTGGYNRALAQVEAEYFILLNSDVDVPKGWLGPLVGWMDSHPECGICGPKLLQMNNRRRFEYAGACGGLLDALGFPYCRGRVLSALEEDDGRYDAPADVAWVSGAALMIRSGLWRSLGGLDDRFFAHMEEIDLCWRASASGYKVTVIPSSEVYHLGGGTLSSDSPRKLYFNYRNNLLMLDGNLPAGRRWVLPVRYCIDSLACLVYLLTFHGEKFKAVLRAHSDFRSLRRGPLPGVRVNVLSDTLLLFEYLRKK